MAKIAKQDSDQLADVIAGGLNKFFTEEKIAYISTEETPTDLVSFVSTGCAPLDLAISNRPNGGIPFGRITEITGLESSGKSLLCAHAMANTQKEDGVAVLIDTETAVNWEFFEAVGIRRDKNWVYARLNNIEDIFTCIENIIETVRRSNKNKPVIIVVDSLAAASTKKELEGTYDTQGYNTNKAILIGQALRKITSTIGTEKIALVFTNQLRQKLNAMPFGDQYTTSGGKAVPYHASVRIRITQVGKITKKNDTGKETIGVTVKAQVVKNRLGPPFRSAEFDIFFDRGIDNYGSWLKFLRDKGVVQGKSNALTYNSENLNKEFKFEEKEWKKLLDSNSDLHKDIYLKLCESYIMSYKSEDLTTEDFDVQSFSED